MNKAILILLSGSLLSSGCTTIVVDRTPGEGPKATVVLKALKDDDPERLTHGYDFRVSRDGRHVGTWSSNSKTPIVVRDLEPGRYRFFITGRRIRSEEAVEEVRAGETVTVTLLASRARHSARLGTFAEITGKVFLYTALVVFYVTFELTMLLIDPEDDDECDTCGCCPCRCESRAPDGPRPRGRVVVESSIR